LEPEERNELPHFPEPSTSSFEGVSNEKPMHAGESAGSNGPLLLSSILGVKGAVRAARCGRCCLVWLNCIWYWPPEGVVPFFEKSRFLHVGAL